MNTRYAFPVAVAVAVHATLAFGFRHAPPPVTPPKVVENHIGCIFEVPPDPPEVHPEPDPGPKGSPDVGRPELPDTPQILKVNDFTIDSRPEGPRIERDSYKIDGREWGTPDGVDHSKYRDRIISSVLLDNPPNVRVRLSPDYPTEARRVGLTGDVMVEFEVDETGRVLNPVIVSSSDRLFEAATLRAVLKWRFEPGKREGKVVRFRMAAPVAFRLDDR